MTGKALVVLSDVNLTIYKSFRNIPGVVVRVAPAFSVRDVLDAEQIVITQAALDKLDSVYGGAVSEKSEPTEEATA